MWRRYIRWIYEYEDSSDEDILNKYEDSSDEDVSSVLDEHEDCDEDTLDECKDNSSDEDVSFTFKDQYDGLQNTQPYYGDAKPYFPNKSVMLMFIWCTKHMIGIIMINTISLYFIFSEPLTNNNNLFINTRISCLSGFSKDLTAFRFSRIRSSSQYYNIKTNATWPSIDDFK